MFFDHSFVRIKIFQMKNILKLMLLLTVFAVGLSACSKEKKIENQLKRGSGKWNIKRLDYSESGTGGLDNNETTWDVGSFEFNKDKTIVKTIYIAPNTTVTTGTWINDEDKITVSWSDGKTDILWIEEDPKKCKMRLYESHTTYYISGSGGSGSSPSITLKYIYYLERAK